MNDLMPQFRWNSAALTNVGNRRDVNEDAYFNAPGRGIWAVADGMGGHDAGNLASQMTVQALEAIDPTNSAQAPGDQIAGALQAVNARLFAKSRENPDKVSTIGSTVAVLVATAGQGLCLWAGDSRIYRLRNFLLNQLTRDHSEVEFLIAERGLSRFEAEKHPDANVITRAVGAEDYLHLESSCGGIKSRDRYLLCSDGLTREVPAEEIAEILSRGSCIDACRDLVRCALSRRCSDNVTVVTVDFEELG